MVSDGSRGEDGRRSPRVGGEGDKIGLRRCRGGDSRNEGREEGVEVEGGKIGGMRGRGEKEIGEGERREGKGMKAERGVKGQERKRRGKEEKGTERK